MISRKDLLTKMADKCATWDDAIKCAVDVEMRYGIEARPLISKEDWLAERERLLNKPSWDDAPDDAILLGLDSNCEWYWHTVKPVTNNIEHCISEGGYYAGRAISIPAGYDWRGSLEERPLIG